MKIISTCEKEFLVKCIAKNSRLDGRSLTEGRNLEIIFGQEWGCCMVLMGNTRVLAQVSGEVTEPKTNTPTEGALYINLELSSMSAPDVQFQSRISDEFVESQRVLERCIRDSKCIDLESLCIVAGSKVWAVRVDIHALNDTGNLVECSSIAAVAALAHFKRPDVSIAGTDVTVLTLTDREPIPLVLHHMPISINLALFNQGEHILIDPLEIEEKIADGCYIIGLNAHQEICLVHRRGVLLLSSDTIQKCENIAIRRSQFVTKLIRNALDDDAYNRVTKAPIGFVNMMQTGTILGIKQPIKKVDLHEIAKQVEAEQAAEKDNMEVTVVGDNIDIAAVGETGLSSNLPIITSLGVSQARKRASMLLKEAHEAGIFEGGVNKWKNLSDDDESSEEEVSATEQQVTKTPLKKEIVSDDDESDESVAIPVDKLEVKPASSRGWYSKDPFS